MFDYSKQEGFFRAVEMCNGNGACRKTQGGAMCPSYRATLDEQDTTRGRANALRLALTAAAARVGASARRGAVLPASGGSHEVFDLCLMCKACKAECPATWTWPS